MMPMDHSVVLFTSDRGITPADAAKAAEDAGFHAFYVPEHSHIPTSRDSAHPVSVEVFEVSKSGWKCIGIYQEP